MKHGVRLYAFEQARLPPRDGIVPPFCVFLHGVTNVGKTTIIDNFSAALNFGIYYKTTESYWENFNNQPIVAFEVKKYLS